MSKHPPPAPTTSAVSPCLTMIQISRTPRHWKFTQHHRTARPPRTPLHIGVGRFRKLGGQGGANSQQAHDVVMTSMRRNDVASTSFRRHVPTRFLTNRCQIISFLILKYDIIENSRIELRGIVLPVQVGGLLGGGGKRVCWLPSQIIGGPAPPPPPPPPPPPLPTPMLQ